MTEELLDHRTTIQTGIEISLVLCETLVAGGALLKMLKYFEGILNIFEFLHV